MTVWVRSSVVSDRVDGILNIMSDMRGWMGNV